ncbi:MAG: hypothetical protein ACRD4F_18370, partial [Candidatus Angelobacter sp.]
AEQTSTIHNLPVRTPTDVLGFTRHPCANIRRGPQVLSCKFFSYFEAADCQSKLRFPWTFYGKGKEFFGQDIFLYRVLAYKCFIYLI